jgi:CRISPR/Cas system endoribonuclease Cas6 (RAMP superfamily)
MKDNITIKDLERRAKAASALLDYAPSVGVGCAE